MTGGRRIALLGCGYTLSRAAAGLDRTDIVVTASSPDSTARLAEAGYDAHTVQLSDRNAVENFFARHPELEVLVDGIPPLDGGSAGPEAVSEAAVTSCPRLRRIIYLSTTGVYGGEDGVWVREDSTCAPVSDAGRARLACEQAYRSLSVPVCALRIAAIYGPGRGIGTALRKGSYRIVGDGSRWSNRIHVSDLAGAIKAAVLFDRKLPQVMNASDGVPARIREIVEYYCEAFGLAAPPSVPLDDARRTMHPSMLSNQRVASELIREQLGLFWRYPSYEKGAITEFI